MLFGATGQADRTEIVGEEVADMSASGLWPSDHAGLVARLIVGRDRGVRGNR